LFVNLGIRNPRSPPKIKVIAKIGNKDFGSFHPIRTAEGTSTRKAIRIPLRIGFMFKSIVAMKKPTITHIKKAEMFASQVNFLMIIGITSIIPAAMPSKIPIMIVFMVKLF
jgi:hypothetical protein